MNDQMIAQLFAKIGFKVDLTGITKARAELKRLEHQAKATGRAVDNALKAAGGRATSTTAATKALTQAQFAAQLQGAKLQRLNQQAAATGLKTQQQQVKLQIQQQNLAAATAKANAAAAKGQMQAQAQTLANQLGQLRITNAVAAAQQRAQQAAVRHQLLQHRLARAQNGAAQGNNGPSGAHRGGGLVGFGASAVHRFGGFGNGVAGVAGGGIGSGLSGLSGAAVGAAGALGSILGPAALVVAALGAVAAAAFGFAREAERAGNTRQQRMTQFEAVGEKSPQNAEVMNARFENFAQTEGLSTKVLGTDYGKLVGALSSRIGVDKAADVTEGIMRFGNAQHLSNDNMQRISVGLRQALGKGQLYSEEWTGQIAEHLGPNANMFGAEAWAKTSGSGLTGAAAEKAFAKDRQDRKIAGDDLVRFMQNLGSILDSHANDGGMLDAARRTQNANDNRISNQYQANMARAFNDSGLSDSMPELSGSFATLLNALEPQFESLGKASNFVVSGLDRIVQSMTTLANWWNKGESFFDPKFTEELGFAFQELGTSLSTLWHTLTANFGESQVSMLKTAGEVLVGIVSIVIDCITAFVDVMVWVSRKVQDILHAMPTALGGTTDADYEKILKQREIDDARRKADQDERQRRADARAGLIVDSPGYNDAVIAQQAQAVGAPQGYDPDVPMVPPAMTRPPATNPVPPAVNSQAVNNTTNNKTEVTITTGPTHITTGVHASELEQALAKQNQDFHNEIAYQFGSMAAPANVFKQRSN